MNSRNLDSSFFWYSSLLTCSNLYNVGSKPRSLLVTCCAVDTLLVLTSTAPVQNYGLCLLLLCRGHPSYSNLHSACSKLWPQLVYEAQSHVSYGTLLTKTRYELSRQLSHFAIKMYKCEMDLYSQIPVVCTHIGSHKVTVQFPIYLVNIVHKIMKA